MSVTSVEIMSLLRQNDAMTLFRRNNDIIATGMPVYHSPKIDMFKQV